MIGLRQRRPPEDHDLVADEFVEGSLPAEDDLGHCGEIFVEGRHDFGRRMLFGKGCEAADVGEEDADFAPLAAEFGHVRVADQLLDDAFGDIARKEPADVTALFLVGAVAVDSDG